MKRNKHTVGPEEYLILQPQVDVITKDFTGNWALNSCIFKGRVPHPFLSPSQKPSLFSACISQTVAVMSSAFCLTPWFPADLPIICKCHSACHLTLLPPHFGVTAMPTVWQPGHLLQSQDCSVGDRKCFSAGRSCRCHDRLHHLRTRLTELWFALEETSSFK